MDGLVVDKKGGIFFEYLSNYGWLLIFFIGIMAFLFYTGVFSFGLLGSLRCSPPMDFMCRDPYIDDKALSFTLISLNPVEIRLRSIRLDNALCPYEQVFDPPLRLEQRKTQKVAINCNPMPKKVEGDIILEYTTVRSDLIHKVEGKILFVRSSSFSLGSLLPWRPS
ncbi:hypothetical protein GOV09_01115 [Candidatus Woesearchaeota archaeon]|nr:hypothetical protein [Candidatus Woesearchaeota archaeon]